MYLLLVKEQIKVKIVLSTKGLLFQLSQRAESTGQGLLR